MSVKIHTDDHLILDDEYANYAAESNFTGFPEDEFQEISWYSEWDRKCEDASHEDELEPITAGAVVTYENHPFQG